MGWRRCFSKGFCTGLAREGFRVDLCSKHQVSLSCVQDFLVRLLLIFKASVLKLKHPHAALK